MDILDLSIQIIFFILGTISGYYISYVFNERSSKENKQLFEQRFGPQLIRILVGETDFKYKNFSEESSDAKEAIGRYVAQRWSTKNSTILLDAGTTTERVARNLSILDIDNLVVCTANPIAALHFMSRGRRNCYIFPGEIDENYAGTISNEELITSVVQFAEEKVGLAGGIDNHRYRVGIIGALPIFPITGPCSNDQRTIHIKRSIINLCEEIVIVVDISKFFDEGKYKGKYYPVFEDKDDWGNLLTGGIGFHKRVSIVTYQQNDNDEKQLEIIRKLNNLYHSSIHCVYSNIR